MRLAERKRPRACSVAVDCKRDARGIDARLSRFNFKSWKVLISTSGGIVEVGTRPFSRPARKRKAARMGPPVREEDEMKGRVAPCDGRKSRGRERDARSTQSRSPSPWSTIFTYKYGKWFFLFSQCLQLKMFGRICAWDYILLLFCFLHYYSQNRLYSNIYIYVHVTYRCPNDCANQSSLRE